MRNTIIWKNISETEQDKILRRPSTTSALNLRAKVQEIINDVRLNGDTACKKLTKKYDNVDVMNMMVSAEEFILARSQVKQSTVTAMEKIINQLYAFHIKQKQNDIRVETATGIVCERQSRPIQRVGLYIPGGTAPLVSTVLMLGVPSQIADCAIRILCSPPRKDGSIDPHILVAAELCGINKIYKIGGAQAIAAMAFGTETIPKVDKIFGPGNPWVTQAKMLVAQETEGALYEMPAGPSEVMVIADANANPEFVAADLLSQAEHGRDSQVFLVCTDCNIANKVNQAIKTQIKLLTRSSIAEDALINSSIILVDTIQEAIVIANRYAPEHLILNIKNPRDYLEHIQCAGSVFLGQWSPEAAGDYASGTNHVLPTGGFAKCLSGLSVNDFTKSITIQELTREGLSTIAEMIRELTNVEGLDAHQKAVDIRLLGDNRNE